MRGEEHGGHEGSAERPGFDFVGPLGISWDAIRPRLRHDKLGGGETMILDRMSFPVVLAPLAGGPSTPQLAAAVSEAGGLGFLASGYLSAEKTREQVLAARQLTSKPLGVGLFTPGAGPTPPSAYAGYRTRLQDWAERHDLPLGEPTFTDDDWEAKLQLLMNEPVEVVSFTFGCPPAAVMEQIKGVGSESWVTVTSVSEAERAQDAGADVLVVQGSEAGGHRGSFADHPGAPDHGLLSLLQLVRAAVALPLVASGGIATGAAVAAVLAAGARGAQLGTAFMLCPEAGTAPGHRAALASPRETTLTRAFTGRLARGIRTTFIDEHEHAPIAYPELHHLTAPLRARARERGDAESVNLWAGEAHELALELPAGEVVARLAAEARASLSTLAELLSVPPPQP